MRPSAVLVLALSALASAIPTDVDVDIDSHKHKVPPMVKITMFHRYDCKNMIFVSKNRKAEIEPPCQAQDMPGNDNSTCWHWPGTTGWRAWKVTEINQHYENQTCRWEGFVKKKCEGDSVGVIDTGFWSCNTFDRRPNQEAWNSVRVSCWATEDQPLEESPKPEDGDDEEE